MMISTRGRYALRIMIDLAEHQNGDYIPMKEVVKRQELSPKYVEQIMPFLTKNGYVEGLHGKGGGYRLHKPPKECNVRDILRLTEGDLAPVACLACSAAPCHRAEFCKTLPMWAKLNRMINDFFNAITIEDLVQNRI